MDAFHTKKALEMYKRLPKSKPKAVELLSSTVTPDSETQIEFRKLRDELEQEGWFERDMVHEFKLLGIWASLVMSAAVTAHSVPVLSSFLLGLSMTNAGWLGHDYVHGVDDFSQKMRNFAAVAAGLDPTWWSDKHNKHHALSTYYIVKTCALLNAFFNSLSSFVAANEMGVDEDIATDPFLYQWPPAPENDSPLRKIQHLIFFVPFSFLFALWRVDSLTVTVDAIEAKRPHAKSELFALLIHYGVLLTLFPLSVWVPAVFMSGLVSALIVTPTHQSEQLFEDYQPDWVTAQFQSTRNAVMSNPFSEWLWGGMQYQLEHHLFPSMPRSKYPKLRSKMMEFANRLKVPGGYRESGEWEILKMNWELYKKVAEADAVPGAPPSKGRVGQLGAIQSTNSPAVSLGALPTIGAKAQ
jgi:fatty acid desaturase